MAKQSPIEWCDSTVNAQMGCDGCELWQPKRNIKICYAGVLTERRTAPGMTAAGWPPSFDQPTIFPGRIAEAAAWKDLTGTTRPAKPWLDGQPRIIFLDDMGDTFTESLPLDWLGPELAVMGASRHAWLILTKRPQRFAEFAKQFSLPPQVWAGASVTRRKTLARVDQLKRVPAAVRFLSIEPVFEHIAGCIDWSGIDWAIIGGASGPRAWKCDVRWIRDLVEDCLAHGVKPFVKQVGANPYDSEWPMEPRRWNLRDAKGGDWSEWPEEFRVRQMPAVAV